MLTVLLLRLPGRVSTPFKLAVGSLFVPLFGLAGSGQQLVQKAGRAVIPRQSLIKENEQLRRENEELKIQLLQAASQARENERLRQLLGFAKTAPWKVRLARVIARDPANWWRDIQIDLGQREGLRPGLPVLTSQGLVGRVTDVSETHSRVALVGDPSCRVAAFVMDGREVRDNGVIVGASSVIDSSLVQLTYLSRTTGLKPGQAVVTSGLGGAFPKGIPIGHLVDFRSVEYGLYAEARVKLDVDLNALEEVWVML